MAAGRGDWWHKGLSRRHVLTGTALGSAGLAATILAGCGEQRPATTSEPATKQPKRGGVVTRAGGDVGSYDTRGVGFDPHTYLAVAILGYRLFYQGLLAYNLRTYEVESELAQKWEQPSPTEYIFHLQPGVKWHNKPPANGRELTLDDIVFSLERARTPEPRFLSRSILLAVDKIEAIDRTRLRITTREPDATTLSKLSADLLMVVLPELVERVPRIASAETVIGTGAFIMKSVQDNVGGEYVRNPDYWKPGLPYLDAVRTHHFADEQTAYAALRGGQVDIARVPGDEIKRYIAQQGAGYTPDWFKDNTTILFQPNTRVKPFDDARVTRALRLLLDYDEMRAAWAETLFGRGRHGSILPTALEAWDFTEEEYTRFLPWKQPKDEAAREALALLSAAGFTRENPLKFEMVLPANVQFPIAAQLAQAQWRRLGQGTVDAQIRPIDLAAANQLRAQRNFTFLLHGNVPGTNEPDSWLTEVYRTGGSANFTSFSDPRADEMIDRQRAIFDPQERKALVKEIVRYMIDHVPSAMPSNRYFLNAVNPKIRDYVPEYWMYGRQYEWIWLDT